MAAFISLAELARGLRAGDFSSRELTTEFLDRIRRHDAALNSFITVADGSSLGPVTDIALEVRRAAGELAAARQRLEQGRIGVALAERSLAIVADRYREGLTAVTELLDAETALSHARLRHLTARRDLLLARASLDLATGRL